MAKDTHITAPTRFVEAGGIRYAYRRFGSESGTPSKAVAWYSGSRTHRASIARGAGHVASSTTRICRIVAIIMPSHVCAENFVRLIQRGIT
jgi:hypothetical protein